MRRQAAPQDELDCDDLVAKRMATANISITN
jgi:hypothetical protein